MRKNEYTSSLGTRQVATAGACRGRGGRVTSTSPGAIAPVDEHEPVAAQTHVLELRVPVKKRGRKFRQRRVQGAGIGVHRRHGGADVIGDEVVEQIPALDDDRPHRMRTGAVVRSMK